MRWVSVKKKLPNISQKSPFDFANMHSDTVLVWENGIARFGYYNHQLEEWSVEGRKGNLKVTHWAYIKEPEK